MDNNDEKVEAAKPEEKQKKSKPQNKKKKKKKRSAVLPVILVLLLIVGAVVAIMYFNVAGLRDDVIFPALRNVPIIQTLVPAPKGNEFVGQPNDQLIAQLEQYQEDLRLKDATIDDLNASLQNANETILQLNKIKEQQDQFKKDKEDFDRMIAANDTRAYQKFYEKISPANADKIYSELVQQGIESDALRQIYKMYEEMWAEDAGAALNELMDTNSELVVQILTSIDSRRAADIIAEMDTAKAAVVTRQMLGQATTEATTEAAD